LDYHIISQSEDKVKEKSARQSKNQADFLKGSTYYARLLSLSSIIIISQIRAKVKKKPHVSQGERTCGLKGMFTHHQSSTVVE